MHLLFQTTRPLGPETGAGDDDDVGSVGQAIQTCPQPSMPSADAVIILGQTLRNSIGSKPSSTSVAAVQNGEASRGLSFAPDYAAFASTTSIAVPLCSASLFSPSSLRCRSGR